MVVQVRGLAVHSPADLFTQCQKGKAREFALQILEKRYPYEAISKKGEKIGTIDASSCIGVIYRTSDHLYVQHLDGRPMETLLKILDRNMLSKEIQVTLIGGCLEAKRPHNNFTDFSHLEKHTKNNLETLFAFWNQSGFLVNVQGWVLGEGNKYQNLCSDFLVGGEGIYLLKQGEVGSLNLKNKGSLIPEAARRLATILLYPDYFCICHASRKFLELSKLERLEKLMMLTQVINNWTDKKILEDFSTTPNLEPPYFSQLMRNMANYVSQQGNFVEAVTFPLSEDQPVFAIQGEVVHLPLSAGHAKSVASLAV